MRVSFVVASLTALGGALARVPAARADDATLEGTVSDEGGASSFTVSLCGGALVPFGATKETHTLGLGAGLRMAWTSRIGLGVEAAVDYSPLPHVEVPGSRFDTVYGAATMGPRFAVGWSALRFALVAGGGVAAEHTTRTDSATRVRTNRVAPAVQGALEIELHLASAGGILLTGGATRTFNDQQYRYAWGMGGLTLAF